MTTRPSPTVDVNVLLRTANGVVGALLFVVLLAFPEEGNQYVDRVTIALGVLLCLQTHVALLIERMRRDPFVILLAFSMTFYFSLRVFTLALIPFSIVFDRYGFGPGDANFALVFIIVANTLLYAGFIAVRSKPDQRIEAGPWRATSPRAVVVLMSVTFMLAYFSGDYWTGGNLPRALTVAKVLLSPEIIVSMALAYWLVFRRSLSRKTALAIGLLLLLEMTAHTLWGSRSALIYFIQSCLLVALAVQGFVALKRKYVVLGVGLLPVMGVVMVMAFAISTYNRLTRQAAGPRQSLDVASALKNAREGGAELFDQSVDVLLPPVLARAGYFDFSAELIAHRDEYRRVVNLPAYTRSVIDNVFTPGFDVFDQPKTANALRFVYLHGGVPSKAAVDEAYHSDQLGMYGEFYTLFGYVSLPLFFIVAYLLKRLYVGLRSDNPFFLAMKRVVVLFMFAKLIDSFGVDWIIADMVPFIVAIAIYSIFFSSRRVSRTEVGPVPSGLPPGFANA